MIIDGKIKLKNGTQVERFTPKGLRFADGSELAADVVLFATGSVLPFFPALHSLLTTRRQLRGHARRDQRARGPRGGRAGRAHLGAQRRGRGPHRVARGRPAQFVAHDGQPCVVPVLLEAPCPSCVLRAFIRPNCCR